MRIFAVLLLIAASPAVAQAQTQAPIPAEPWQPTAPYVISGQDEPGYRNWMAASPRHPAYVKAFNDYLTTWGVAGVVPTWQLLRTASDWMKCGAAPFELPPTDNWPNVVQTLRYIRDQVIPAIGPVEPVSVYRNPVLNHCAGGANESAHRFMQAVDMVPLRPMTRETLIRTLCAGHAINGARYAVGLGFYPFIRFHVDSRKFRTWGQHDTGGIACAESFALAHAADLPKADGVDSPP
ncbi:MAG: hypothetical protein ABIS38_04935 [Sphingomicrobium sp.]